MVTVGNVTECTGGRPEFYELLLGISWSMVQATVGNITECAIVLLGI